MSSRRRISVEQVKGLQDFRMNINYVSYWSKRTGKPVKGYLGHPHDTTLTVSFDEGQIIQGKLMKDGYIAVPINKKITVVLSPTDAAPLDDSQHSDMNGMNDWFNR